MNTENKIEDGGPAFPEHGGGMFGEHVTRTRGMTMRDWFAGQALAGLLANPLTRASEETVATAAWHQAEAMIEAGRVK